MSNDVLDEGAAPFRMPVELGKVREFTQAIGGRMPTADPALSPPTFLVTATLWQEAHSRVSPQPPLDRSRLLHGEQEFVFSKSPPRSGDVLIGTARIDSDFRKEGSRGGTMRFVEQVAEFRDGAGDLVAEVRTTLIETGKAVEA